MSYGSILRIGTSSGTRNQNKALPAIILVGVNMLSHILLSSYKVHTNTKNIRRYWFIVPVRA